MDKHWAKKFLLLFGCKGLAVPNHPGWDAL